MLSESLLTARQVLVEYCGGAFPTWFAPVTSLTLTEKFDHNAPRSLKLFAAAGVRATGGLSSANLGAKVKSGYEMKQNWATTLVRFLRTLYLKRVALRLEFKGDIECNIEGRAALPTGG